MSLNGGYKIIDFKDTNITTENGITVTGTYEALENNHRKAILISGIVIDGVEKPDCFVSCTGGNSEAYTFTAYGHTWTVNTDDTITIV